MCIMCVVCNEFVCVLCVHMLYVYVCSEGLCACVLCVYDVCGMWSEFVCIAVICV